MHEHDEIIAPVTHIEVDSKGSSIDPEVPNCHQRTNRFQS